MTSAAQELVLQPGGRDRAELLELSETLAGEGPWELTAGSRRVSVPEEFVEVLRTIVTTLQHGDAVAVSPHEAVVSTQEAAAVLGVSRPTVVRLLENGALPYEQPGSHRRVRLADVIAYRDARGHAARSLPDAGSEAGSDEGDQPRSRA